MRLYPALAALVALALAGCVPQTQAPVTPAAPAASAAHPVVGGAIMYPNRPILQNAASSRDHSTLVAAVQAAGLTDRLSGAGPFTVFAPTNAAFDKLPPGTVETLRHPSNKALLARILGYHVVPGRKTRADIAADIRAGGGTASYRTVAGETIRLRMVGNSLLVWDANNARSAISQADVLQSNGVIHVVDSVLLPTMRAG